MFESVARPAPKSRERRIVALLLSVGLNAVIAAGLFLVGSGALPEPARAADPPERYVEIVSPPAPAAGGSAPHAVAPHHTEAPKPPPPVTPPPAVPDPTPPLLPDPAAAVPDPTAPDATTADADPGADAGNGTGKGPGKDVGPGKGVGTGGCVGAECGNGSALRVVHWSEVEARVRVKPQFPDMARQLGIREAVCVVRLSIDPHGVPIAAEPRDCPPAFQVATVDAAMKWRFYPVVQEGHGVSAQFDLRVKYESE